MAEHLSIPTTSPSTRYESQGAALAAVLVGGIVALSGTAYMTTAHDGTVTINCQEAPKPDGAVVAVDGQPQEVRAAIDGQSTSLGFFKKAPAAGGERPAFRVVRAATRKEDYAAFDTLDWDIDHSRVKVSWMAGVLGARVVVRC